MWIYAFGESAISYLINHTSESFILHTQTFKHSIANTFIEKGKNAIYYITSRENAQINYDEKQLVQVYTKTAEWSADCVHLVPHGW